MSLYTNIIISPSEYKKANVIRSTLLLYLEKELEEELKKEYIGLKTNTNEKILAQTQSLKVEFKETFSGKKDSSNNPLCTTEYIGGIEQVHYVASRIGSLGDIGFSQRQNIPLYRVLDIENSNDHNYSTNEKCKNIFKSDNKLIKKEKSKKKKFISFNKAHHCLKSNRLKKSNDIIFKTEEDTKKDEKNYYDLNNYYTQGYLDKNSNSFLQNVNPFTLKENDKPYYKNYFKIDYSTCSNKDSVEIKNFMNIPTYDSNIKTISTTVQNSTFHIKKSRSNLSSNKSIKNYYSVNDRYEEMKKLEEKENKIPTCLKKNKFKTKNFGELTPIPSVDKENIPQIPIKRINKRGQQKMFHKGKIRKGNSVTREIKKSLYLQNIINNVDDSFAYNGFNRERNSKSNTVKVECSQMYLAALCLDLKMPSKIIKAKNKKKTDKQKKIK